MDKELIAEAISATELLDIYLNSSSIRRSDDFDLSYPHENWAQQGRLALEAHIIERETGDRVLRALVTCGVRFVTKKEGEADDVQEEVLSEVEAVFCALYRAEPGLADEAIHEFLQHNAVHNVWPFWREHALRMSAEAKLPRPVIPLMKPRKR